MTVTGIISAVLIGVVIGALARLILPGKQKIGIILTVLIGIVAALIGTWATNAIGYGDAKGYDAFELIAQVLLAVIGVGIVTAILRGGTRGRLRT